MKNSIIYTGLAVLLILLISYGCMKEINDISLIEETEEIVAVDSLPPIIGLGTRVYDYPGEGNNYAVSFSIGSKIYMGFGFNESGPVYDFWECDYDKAIMDCDLATKNMWTKLPDFPGSFSKSGRSEATPLGFSVNGKGYILPGAFWDNGKFVNELWEFDPETSAWSRKADPPKPCTIFCNGLLNWHKNIYRNG